MFTSVKSCRIAIIFLIVILTVCCSVASSATKTVWLSELDLTKMSAGWGKPVADKSVQDKMLSISGVKYEKGVGTHASSVMYVELGGQTKSFSAFVGVDDEVDGNIGSVRFQVFGDSNKLFDSGIVKAGQKAKKVDVDLTGVDVMILIAGSAGDRISYDHADWAEAKFEVAGKRPKAVDVPKEEAIILTPKPGPEPKINGPKVYGARPGNPFIYRIPATGKRPMKFSTRSLPVSLKLDSNTGIITGNTPDKAGKYSVTLVAENSFGRAEREFVIVAGDTLALTPPMGWNSWYIHYNRVTDSDMRGAADTMISSGMADYGYQYVNIAE